MSGWALFLVWLVFYLPILYLVIKSEEPRRMAKCSFCSSSLEEIHDFGEVALAGAFVKPGQFDGEKKYPLRIGYCRACYSLQVLDRIAPDIMFRDYFYFSSATESIKRHFREYADEMVSRFNPKTAIEIGCNDGVLIEPLRGLGVTVTGVDPSNAIPEGQGMIRDYFTESVAAKIGHVDLIAANNVFAHVDDINALTQAITLSLSEYGVLVIEVHSLSEMLEKLQYDWIYHEHIYYYSLLSLEVHLSSFGLSVFDVKPVPTHGGSMRYYVCRKDKYEVCESVSALREKEKKQGLDRLSTFETFSDSIQSHRKALKRVIGSLSGKVAGYGASGRANTILQYCGLHVDYIVDDAPAKHGFFTPGTHIPIVSRETLRTDPPDHVIAFAWGYADEIQKKCGLPLIVPLPQIRNLEHKAAA